LGVGPHIRDGGLRALAHHVAEHAGQDQMLLRARHHGDLDEEDVAADRRPGKTRGYSRSCGPLRHLVDEARPSEVLAQVLDGYLNWLPPAPAHKTGTLFTH